MVLGEPEAAHSFGGTGMTNITTKSRRNKPCPKCNGPTIRIDKYDCYACRECMIWCEKSCGDDLCAFCSKRPPTPIGANWEDKNNN